MFKWLNKIGKKAQGTLEYAVLIVVIIAALVAMQTYLKRGVQGRMKESSDQIGSQYSSGYTITNQQTYSMTNMGESSDQATNISNITYHNQYQERTGTENVLNAENEWWGEKK